MRNTYFVGAIAGSLMLMCMASVTWADCGCGGMSNRSYNSLSGPPCFSPPSGCLTPGCCECPPTACDNAWAGYCQHKAKWQAYFTKVGTPRPAYYYGNRCASPCGTPTPAAREAPAEPSPKPVVSPEPDNPPLPPEPTAEKTSRAKVLYPWMR
jgi:hypothetical protein